MRSHEPAPVPLSAAGAQVGCHEHLRLETGWELASSDADAHAGPPGEADLEWLPAQVPGTAAGALLAAGAWEHFERRDFDAEDWWFRTVFEAAPAAPGERIVLRFDGIATVAEVFLNGELVGTVDSMFEPLALDIGAQLRSEGNELAICCRALAPRLRQRRKPRARWRTRLVDGGLRFFRTMLLGRAPGFAPGPAAVGPWRPVVLERRRRFELPAARLRSGLDGDDGVVRLSATLVALGDELPSAAELEVGRGEGAKRTPLEISLGERGSELSGELRLAGPDLWWPHTHGTPALYPVRLLVRAERGELAVELGRVGFRRLAPGPGADHEVERDGLHLQLNGVPVFARGAVWTPADAVGLAPDRERLRGALEQVREAGMNMLRIPGLGAYESPDFHDLCDELGIMVWQDFMFANLDYPVAEGAFRAQVEAEADGVLAAVGGRPSLAVLCGNSEVEQQVAMLGLDPALGRGELFGELLPAAVARAETDAVYVPSAPCGGTLPFRPGTGIANYYGVGGYRRPLEDARRAEVRFAAECLAFANVPDEAGVEAVLPEAPLDVVVHHPRWKQGVPRDAGSGWDFEDVRDHYLRALFGVDAGELRRFDHARYLELSRAVTGEAMAAVFGEWRRVGSPCGGGLVLWLRDLVPGAGWGVLDSRGEPKVAYHHLRRALAPVAVWMTDEGLGGVGVHVAGDRPEPLRGWLRIALYRDGEQQVGEARTELDLPAHGAASYDLEELLGRFVDASWAYRFGPPAQSTIVAAIEQEEGERVRTLSRASLHPAGFPLDPEPAERLGLEALAEPPAEGRVRISLTARRFVYGLRVAAAGARASEDAFDLEPGRTTAIDLVFADSTAAPANIQVSAINLDGRVSFPISR